MLNGVNLISGPSSAPVSAGQINPMERAGSVVHQQQQQSAGAPSASGQQTQQQSHPTQQQSVPQPPQLQTQLPDAGDSGPQTAIFRPDDAGKWREELRLSHEAAERERAEREGHSSSTSNGVSSWERTTSEEEENGGIKEVEEGDDDEDSSSDIVGEGSEGDGAKLWKPKRTLRKYVFSAKSKNRYLTHPPSSHLDAIRAIAFHPTELCLASGGDDSTVKIWRMDVSGLASST